MAKKLWQCSECGTTFEKEYTYNFSAEVSKNAGHYGLGPKCPVCGSRKQKKMIDSTE